MAAMRFVYSRPFVHSAITGMFDEKWLDDNYKALELYRQGRGAQEKGMRSIAEKMRPLGPGWLPAEYRWLDEQWRG